MNLKTAFNSALRTCVAVNVSPLAPMTDATPEEWLLLAPYGDHPLSVELKPGEWRTFTQRLDKAQAVKMAGAYNSWRAQLGRLFRGAPVQIGHPRMDPKRWPDDSRIGSIREVEAREDGVYVLTAWNSRGRHNRSEGEHVYPSAEWDYDFDEAMQTGMILPAELSGVGMTNFPNISSVPPWTNSRPHGAPAPTITTNPQARGVIVARLAQAKNKNTQ